MREHFLLDTGPLQEFFILRYEAQTGSRWPDRTFQFHALLTQRDREDFPKFIQANRGYLRTTSGVVTEMHGFLQRAERDYEWRARPDLRRRFWALVWATFREFGMQEDTVPVVEMAEQVLVDYGPVDAGLLELAKRSVKQVSRIVVLTADKALRELCLRHEVRADYVTDRLEEFRKTV